MPGAVPFPDEVRLALRLPGALHARLVKLAEADQRSLNSEIVYLLLAQAAITEIRRAANEQLQAWGEAEPHDVNLP